MSYVRANIEDPRRVSEVFTGENGSKRQQEAARGRLHKELGGYRRRGRRGILLGSGCGGVGQNGRQSLVKRMEKRELETLLCTPFIYINYQMRSSSYVTHSVEESSGKQLEVDMQAICCLGGWKESRFV